MSEIVRVGRGGWLSMELRVREWVLLRVLSGGGRVRSEVVRTGPVGEVVGIRLMVKSGLTLSPKDGERWFEVDLPITNRWIA